MEAVVFYQRMKSVTITFGSWCAFVCDVFLIFLYHVFDFKIVVVVVSGVQLTIA